MREQTLRFFQLHNPFYLLSALSMLVGCFGLVQVIGVTPGGTTSLLILIGVLQAYECLVVGLGSYLIRSGRAPRDGRILFLLELVFLVDATYLLTELSAAVPTLGAMMALAVCCLGIVKTGVMLHALGLRVRLRGIAFVSLQLGLLLGSPPLAAVLADQGRLSPTLLYALWWLIGLAALASKWMVDQFSERELPSNWLRPVERNFRVGIMVLPYLSLLWHVGSLHWTYDTPYNLANAAPVLLGLGISLSNAGARWLSRGVRLTIHWLAPMAALLTSVGFPETLVFHLWEVTGSPLRVALLAATIVYVVSYFQFRRPALFMAAAASFLTGLAGYSLVTIVETVSAASQFVPRTAVEWCLLSISAAFVFLIAGAAVSLSAGPPSRGRQAPITRRV